MIHNVPKPRLSPNFTIEDIHKIREWNYERLKDASVQEIIDDTDKNSEVISVKIEVIAKRKSRCRAV